MYGRSPKILFTFPLSYSHQYAWWPHSHPTKHARRRPSTTSTQAAPTLPQAPHSPTRSAGSNDADRTAQPATIAISAPQLPPKRTAPAAPFQAVSIRHSVRAGALTPLCTPVSPAHTVPATLTLAFSAQAAACVTQHSAP